MLEAKSVGKKGKNGSLFESAYTPRLIILEKAHRFSGMTFMMRLIRGLLLGIHVSFQKSCYVVLHLSLSAKNGFGD